MAAAVQLRFSLSLHSKPKTVHLCGSWDGYQSQYPLSKDSNKSGGWVGMFRFQPGMVKQGQRYWYYYIVDGYKPDYDKARPSVTEPTTGRQLNVLDIPPPAKNSSSSSSSSSSTRHGSASTSSRGSHRPTSTSSVAKGRSLSPSQIQSPLPSKPYATRHITTEKFDPRDVDRLAYQYSRHAVSGSATSASSRESSSYTSDGSSSAESSDSEGGSDISSDVPSLSRSSHTSSPSSISSGSSCCVCERYAITRSGARVKLDCGGQRCGYSDQSSECSSESEGEKKKYARHATRRHGVVVRR